MMDEAQRFHHKWLGMVQPIEGLVVSVPVLREAQCFERQSTAVYRLFKELCPLLKNADFQATEHPLEGSGRGNLRAIRDLGEFLAKLLQLTPDMLDRGDALPDALELYVAEGQELLRPTLGLRHVHALSTLAPTGEATAAARAGAAYVMLVTELPLGTDLDRPDSRPGAWAYPPAAKFDRLLRACEVPIGLLCNGLEARLMYAPRGESTGSLTFRVDAMARSDGYVLLDALVMLLSSQRFFGARPEHQLPQLLAQSRKCQAEVTNALAKQVSAALQELMEGFAQAAQRDGWEQVQDAIDRGGDHLYGGLMTVLLRLVFLLYCEDRELLPVGQQVFARNLSLQRLFAELQEDQSMYPDTMGQRFGAWGRLVALFRAVYCGVHHAELTLPPRRGDLFDPNTYSFLEGWHRGSAPIRQYVAQAKVNLPSVSDATVFAVLQRLIVLDGQRLSYRSLDVEQIGSVYEAVMGFHVERVNSPAVCLRGCATWVTAEEVLQVAPDQRVAWLKGDVGMDKGAATKLAQALKGCKHAEAVMAALQGAQQSGMQPAILGDLVLQPGKQRRRTSSHYTPRSMTQPIVERGLAPILRSLGEHPTSAQILDLKVCDPAMGSGAFLVAACRYLADRLVEAWSREPEHRHHLTDANEEALVAARRLVAQRCLYGVDKNLFSVRLAKLSLWAFTLARDLPFTFMDHSLRWGDSLVGLTLAQIKGFDWTADPEPIPEFAQLVDAALQEGLPLRHKLRELAFQNGRVSQQTKRRILEDAEDALQHVRVLGDLALGCFFAEKKDRARRERREAVLALAREWVRQDGWEMPEKLHAAWDAARGVVEMFHWQVEFPEACVGEEDTKLHAVVGNPPFMGKNGIGNLGVTSYLDWLQTVHEGAHGNADYSAHFFRRAYGLLGGSGTISFIATNTISQGDTRATGLLPLVEKGVKIYSAECNKQWEGAAAITVSIVQMAKGKCCSSATPSLLDGAVVASISSQLQPGVERAAAAELKINDNISFIGSYVLGTGFVLNPEEHATCLRVRPANKIIINPYIGGEEVNTSPTQAFDRYVINFGDMSLEEAEKWPDLIEIVRKKVKPDRDKNKIATRRENWWKFASSADGLYQAIDGVPRCLVISRVTKHLCLSFQPTDRVFSEALIVIALPTYAAFAILQSRPHEIWARELCSTMETRLRYVPTDCFRNFPFPHNDLRTPDPRVEAAGEAYYTARADFMVSTDQGLTKTYNAMQDPKCDDAPVEKLRKLHEAMDRAVLNAYGWKDIEVPRYCPSTPDEERAAQAFNATVLDRLFALNASRAAEEQRASPAPAKAPKRPKDSKRPSPVARKKKETR